MQTAGVQSLQRRHFGIHRFVLVELEKEFRHPAGRGELEQGHEQPIAVANEMHRVDAVRVAVHGHATTTGGFDQAENGRGERTRLDDGLEIDGLLLALLVRVEIEMALLRHVRRNRHLDDRFTLVVQWTVD